MPIAAAEFAQVTAVTPAGPGRFTVDIDPEWTIVAKPNGGYLLAILGRAALSSIGAVPVDAAVADHRASDVIAASAHYLRSPVPGPAVAEVVVLRTGRTLSQARVRLVQADLTCVEALFTIGELSDGGTPAWDAGVPAVDMPGPTDCTPVPRTGPGGFDAAIMGRVDLRLDPGCLGFAVGHPSGRGELRGWLALPGGADFDSLSLLYAVDALPPATFEIAVSGWVPTLELTAYLRRRPAPGPVRIVQRVQLIDDGRFDEICQVWDSSGRLVAQASQLALIRLAT